MGCRSDEGCEKLTLWMLQATGLPGLWQSLAVRGHPSSSVSPAESSLCTMPECAASGLDVQEEKEKCLFPNSAAVKKGGKSVAGNYKCSRPTVGCS